MLQIEVCCCFCAIILGQTGLLEGLCSNKKALFLFSYPVPFF